MIAAAAEAKEFVNSTAQVQTYSTHWPCFLYCVYGCDVDVIWQLYIYTPCYPETWDAEENKALIILNFISKFLLPPPYHDNDPYTQRNETENVNSSFATYWFCYDAIITRK